MLRAYGITDKGNVRPTNEDRFAIQEELGLCVIADGMGGHNAGEVAAALAVEAVVDFVREHAASVSSGSHYGLPDERDSGRWPFGFNPALSADGNLLRTAIYLAHMQVLETALSADRYGGMGTTIVAARVAGGRLSVAHVGDSRLYMFAGRQLRQVTFDDSWIATVLAADPEADPLLLQHHPMRSALTNVVGARPRADVHVAEETLAGGELLLLTTDGVHGVLDNQRIERLVGNDDDPCEVVRNVIATALVRGSRDNCTAIVARYVSEA